MHYDFLRKKAPEGIYPMWHALEKAGILEKNRMKFVYQWEFKLEG